MSGQFPTSPVANSANIRSLQRTIVSVTTSGRKQARQIDGQRFSITLDFPPMTRSEFAPIKAFVMKQRSQLNNFTVIPPIVSNAQGVASTTISTDASISAGATTCTVDGMTISTNGILKAGDYFRFTGQTKVYMAVEDLNADGSGEGTLTFEPPLRTLVAENAVLIYDNVDFTVTLVNDVQEYNLGVQGYYSYEIDVAESL
jgi:hypothetical protein|tara:strand:+ start:1905 stop:2507 length:603 start_codon:yes stop_codon:yes gene_type:complete